MTWTWETNTALNVAGAVVIMVFGVLVARVRPRTPQAATVAVFATTFGAATTFGNLRDVVGAQTVTGGFFGWAAAAAMAGTLAALLRAWWVLPVSLDRSERHLLAGPSLLMLAWLAFIAPIVPWEGASPPMAAYLALVTLATTAWWGLLVLLGLRVARPKADPRVRVEAPLLAAALVLYPATVARFMFGSDPFLSRIAWWGPTSTIILATLWIWAWSRAGAPRVGRNLAWLALAVSLVSLIEGLGGVGLTTNGYGLQGIARIASVAILSYAVVRHHVLGIDVKVRWGVSRGTVAAAFVAAFFVASEGAQILFGAENEWLGLFAAGALVFAIAPLQRAAERLAEKAVPTSLPEQNVAPTSPGEEDAFRRAVLWARRDGTLTREEERTLIVIAARLGIPAERAFDIRMEVEGELRSTHQPGAL